MDYLFTRNLLHEYTMKKRKLKEKELKEKRKKECKQQLDVWKDKMCKNHVTNWAHTRGCRMKSAGNFDEEMRNGDDFSVIWR